MTSYLVYNKSTGAQICECATCDDARMMLLFDPDNREVRQRRLLMDQVVDISSVRLPDDKQLKGQLILGPVTNVLPQSDTAPFRP